MEESSCQNKEAMLEDAMRSSHHSSSSLSDWEVISVEHDKPPSPNDVGIDGSLNEVCISEDVKVKLFEGQPNKTNGTQQKIKKTVKENMTVCSCQEESPKEVKYQSVPSNSEYSDSVNENITSLDQVSDLNKKSDLKSEDGAASGESFIESKPSTPSRHCETSGAVEEKVKSTICDSSSVRSKVHENGKQITELQPQPCVDSLHGVYNKLSNLAAAGDETTSDETKLIKTDKNVTQNTELSGDTLSTTINTLSTTETPENINASSIANTYIATHNDNNRTTDNGTKSDNNLATDNGTKSDKIKLLKKDKHWILCFGMTETVLKFEETESVNLKIHDKNVYLQTNSTVYDVTFNQFGEATVTQLQEANVVSKSTASGTENGSVIPKNTSSTPLVNTCTSGKNLKEEIDVGLTRPNCSAGTVNPLATEQFEDKSNHTQPNQNIIEQLKMGKDRLLKEEITETDLDSDDQNDITMYHIDGDFYIKSNNDLYEVKFEADEKTYLVPIGKAVVIPLAAGSSDVKVDNVDDSYVSDYKKEHEAVLDKASKRERFRGEEAKMGKKMESDVKGDVDSTKEDLKDNDDQAGFKTPPVSKLANDDVSTITDMLGKLDINQADNDGIGEQTCPTPESQRVSNDGKNNAKVDIEESKRLNCLNGTKEVNVAVHEAVTQAATHEGSNTHTNTTRTRSNAQPIDTVCSSHTDRSLSTSDTDKGKAPLMVKMKDTGVKAEAGARPNQTTKNTSQKNQDATLSLRITTERATDNPYECRLLAAKFSNTVHNNNIPSHELGIAHVEKSLPSPKEKDVKGENLRATLHQVVEEESKKGRECLSVGIRVDSIKDFIHLKDSKAVAQLAKDSGVIIKNSQVSDCQGFEIEGEPHAVMKCESDLKNVIKAITSASIMLKGGRKSASEIKDNLSRMKTEVSKRFDVSVEFATQITSKQRPGNGKPSSDSKFKQFSKGHENEIEKVERPKLVSWQFPGGYKISLCKESVKQSTAVVHVEFKSWNGKEKQLDHEILPDGMGGYTVKVKAGLPKCRGRNETEELKRLFDRILEKAGNNDHNSLAFSVEDIQTWTLVCFLECLLSAVWNHFKAPKSDKPVFIELCNPKIDEYAAINYQCHGLISKLMENETGCIKSKPLEIRVIENKLNFTKAEVLVNTTSKDLQLDAGAVSSAMLKTAGDGLQADCAEYYPKGIEWGEMAVTMGHQLPSKYVFHGALPPYHMHLSEMDKLTAFRNLMGSCLTKAKELGCKTIAFPVLGAGILKYPVELVAAEMFTCVQKFQQTCGRTTLQTVYFVVYPADKDTLQTFRRLESIFTDAETETAKQKEQERASREDATEQEQKLEDAVEHVKVEITGHNTVVAEASKYTETMWRKIILEEENHYAVRLSPRLEQDICYRQDKRMTQQLASLDAEISETNSECFKTSSSLKTLKQAYVIVDHLLATNNRIQSSLRPFDETDIITKIDNVTETDFRVMEKINKSTLDKYVKMGNKISYDGKCIVIKGKAEVADSIRTEIQKLSTFIKTLNHYCIDVSKMKIGTETINAIVRDIEVKNENVCILFDSKNYRISLFSKQTQTLVDLKREIIERMEANTDWKMSEKSSNQVERQSNIQNEMTAKSKTGQNNVFPIYVQTRSGNLRLFVYEGDLLKAPVACIVNAANEHLTHDAGIAAAIAHAAGTQLRIDSQSHFRRYGNVPAGRVVVTGAGHLQYKCVIHAVGPNWRGYTPLTRTKFQACKDALQSAIRNSLEEMEKYKLKSVAIPAISSGYQGVPIDICAQQYAEAIQRYVKETARPCVEEIRFVDLNKDTVAQIAQTFCEIFVDKKMVSCDSKYLPVEEAAPAVASHTEQPAVKFTGRSKAEYEPKPHSEPKPSSSAGTEFRAKTDDMKAINPVFIYESPLKLTVIRFSTCHELQLYTGNILELKSVAGIVLREDLAGTAKGRIAHGMMEKGGPKYVSTKKAAFQTKPSFGEVIVTDGGISRFQYVFHALIHHRQHFPKDSSKWYSAFQKILGLVFKKAVLFKCDSIAMPIFRIDDKQQSDLSEYAKVVVESYKKFCSANTTQKLTVHLISNAPNLTTVLQSSFHHVISNKQWVSGRSVAVYPPTADTLTTSKIPKKEDQTLKKMAETPTKMKQAPKKEQALSESTSAKDKEDCVICLDKMTLPKKLPCGHTFCKDCIDQHMKTKKNCPICGKVFGEITGNQPKGKMNIHRTRTSLPGYEKYETIEIEYAFPSGTQGPDHPEPGKHYKGITRTAYLPDNTDGRQVLKLLEVAFHRNLTFTIGQSRTTGLSGVITWNDIHHKTNPRPNTQFGYPDPGYFDRVKDELAAKGVTVDDIK